MTALTIPPARAQMLLPDGRPTPDWYRYLHDLQERAGGVNGLSTSDVDAGSFAAMQPYVQQTDSASEIMQPFGGAVDPCDVLQSATCCPVEIYPMQS